MEQVCLSCINKYCANVGIQLFHVLLILIVVNVSTASTNIVPVLLVPCALLVLLVFNVDSVYSVDQCSASVGIQFLAFLVVVNVDSVSTELTNVVPVLAYSCTMPPFSLNSGQW